MPTILTHMVHVCYVHKLQIVLINS